MARQGIAWVYHIELGVISCTHTHTLRNGTKGRKGLGWGSVRASERASQVSKPGQQGLRLGLYFFISSFSFFHFFLFSSNFLYTYLVSSFLPNVVFTTSTIIHRYYFLKGGIYLWSRGIRITILVVKQLRCFGSEKWEFLKQIIYTLSWSSYSLT